MGLINYVLNKDTFALDGYKDTLASDGNEYFKYMYTLSGVKDKYVANLEKAVLVLNNEYDTFMVPDNGSSQLSPYKEINDFISKMNGAFVEKPDYTEKVIKLLVGYNLLVFKLSFLVPKSEGKRELPVSLTTPGLGFWSEFLFKHGRIGELLGNDIEKSYNKMVMSINCYYTHQYISKNYTEGKKVIHINQFVNGSDYGKKFLASLFGITLTKENILTSDDGNTLIVINVNPGGEKIPDSVLKYDDTTEVIIQFAWDSLIKWIGNEYWVGKHFDSMDPVAASSIANHSSVFTTEITDENCVLLE